MHSPILYFIDDSNEESVAQEILDALTKDKLLTDILPTNDDELRNYINESDWLVANTAANPDWHRGAWDVKELLENVFEKKLSLDPQLEGQAIIRLNITKDDILTYQRRKAKAFSDYSLLLEQAVENGDLDWSHSYKGTTLIDGNLVKNSYITTAIKNFINTTGGLKIIQHDLYDDGNGLYLEREDISMIDDLIDTALLHSPDNARDLAGDTVVRSYLVLTDIQGDYHY